jgi:hypothetical protein
MQTRIPLLASILVVACIPATIRTTPRTSPDITPADVRARIFDVADDSMLGRQAGAIGNFKMTDYIAGELERFGLEPAGDNGTFFQVITMVARRADPQSIVAVEGDTLKLFRDYALIRPTSTARIGTRIDLSQVPVVYGGTAGDTTLVLDRTLVKGRLIVLDAALGSDGKPTATYTTAAGTEGVKYPEAAGIAITSLDLQTNPESLQRPNAGLRDPNRAAPSPGGILISTAAAKKLFGANLSQLQPGATGRTVTAHVGFLDSAVRAPARNVVAVRRGSDPALRNEYVAIGAHSDHLAPANTAVEHDSLRAFNQIMKPTGDGRAGTPTQAQWQRILAIRDSMRRIRPPRMDSIYNGADDDGSGSVALLEIAELFASQPAPRRSILFVWHTGEESGLLGSMYFVDHPTVPRIDIVAQVNMDMVGRGREEDTPHGGPRNLEAIGMRRLSTDLGNVVDSVNQKRAVPWNIDLSFDTPGHPQNRYCRSDHQNYARAGIPIVYFSRGHNRDYHAVTDEAQYIEFDALARVAGFVHDVATALANRNDRPRVDKRMPNPLAPCRQ